MAETEVAVRFASKEEAQLFQAFVKLTAGFTKVKDGAEKTKQSTDDLDASLKKFAERQIKLNTTPFQEMLATVGELDKALQAKLLSPEQYAAAHARAAAKMKAAAGEIKTIEMKPVAASAAPVAQGPSEELRKFAERLKAINVTPLERYQREMRKINEAIRAGLLNQEDFRRASVSAHNDYRRELDETHRKLKGTQGAGTSAAKETGGSFAGMLATIGISAGAATALVHKVLSGMREEAKQAAGEITASYKSLGKLGQIGDAKETAERRRMANQYFASGAVGSRQEAAQTILELANSGAIEDRKTFADLQKVGLIDDPSGIATKGRQLQQTLGAKEAGTFPQLIARAFVAAEPVNTTPDVLLGAAARSGESAGTLGISAPDLLAATATMIRAKGNEQGGERLASLLAKLTTMEDVQGTGLFDRLQSIRDKKMSPAELKKFFGDDTAVEAFGILSKGAADTQARSSQVAAAGPQLLDQKIRNQLAVPEIAIAVAAAQQKAGDVLEARDRGLRTIQTDTVAAAGERRIREQYGDVAASATNVGVAAARYIPGIDQHMLDVSQGKASASLRGEDLLRGSGPVGLFVDAHVQLAKLLGKMIEGQEATTAAAKKLDGAADKLSNTRSPSPPRFDWPGAARRDAAVEAR